MGDVAGGDHKAGRRWRQRQCLCGQDHVPIQRVRVSGRPSAFARLRPKVGSKTHSRRREGQVDRRRRQQVQAGNGCGFARTCQLSPHFVVSEFGEMDRPPVRVQVFVPLAAASASGDLPRRCVIRPSELESRKIVPLIPEFLIPGFLINRPGAAPPPPASGSCWL